MSAADLPLFEAGPMARASDRPTSRAAAESQRPKLSDLQQRVLGHFVVAGLHGFTDLELEQLPEFAGYGPSTLRKRRCELMQRHDLEPLLDADGAEVERSGMMVWVLAGLQGSAR